jgi:hypothetical protein
MKSLIVIAAILASLAFAAPASSYPVETDVGGITAAYHGRGIYCFYYVRPPLEILICRRIR